MLINTSFNCTQEHFTNSMSKTKIEVICINCNNIYFRTKKSILYKFKIKQIYPKYCSNKCQLEYQNKNKNITITCANCGSTKTINISRVNIKNNFCTQSCSATYNNKNKTSGTRRSKLETYLEKQLAVLYPDLEIHYNRKDTIQSELDIYIPSLKLAFELNGIFHYEPIYGQDKLNKIQASDQNKFQLCQQHGISLCIIDTSSQKRFTELSSQKYLDIISNIIRQYN